MSGIAGRQREIEERLPALREARKNALADEDTARATKLRQEIENCEQELEDQRTAATVLSERERQRQEAEDRKRRRAAMSRLADLSRARVRIGRKVDLAIASVESCLQELDALDSKVRTTSAEAGTGSDVSRRLGIHGRIFFRGAVLALAPRLALLLGIERLPATVRQPLEVAFKSLGVTETAPAEGEAA